MKNTKFSKSFNKVLEDGYFFYSQFNHDKFQFIAASPQFADPFAAEFHAELQYADSLSTNEDNLAKQVFITAQVNRKMEECRVHYRKLLLYCRINTSSKEQAQEIFGRSSYFKAKSSVIKLHELLSQSHKTAEKPEYKPDLIASGFNQADIDMLGTLASELNGLYLDKQMYMNQSALRTEQRIVAFDKFWERMLLISDFAKQIFHDSPSHSKLYMLYPERKGLYKKKKNAVKRDAT